MLGEVIAAIAAAVDSAVTDRQASPGLLTVAAAGLLLVFTLWWSYFKHEADEEIRQSRHWTFVWAFAHYLVFAAVAAVGAGLQVAIEALTHGARVTPEFAAFAVAIPVAIYIVVLALVSVRSGTGLAALHLTLLTAALVLAAAAATPLLTLPAAIVVMVALVALLLAFHLARLSPAGPEPGAAGEPGEPA